MIEIPVFQETSADFEQNVNLNQQLVNIRITYNIRNSYFHITVTDVNGGVIRNVKIVPRWPLLKQNRGQIVFDGDLLVLKADNSAVDDITYENFGTGWKLYFLTPSEVQKWEEENGL
jgi:hypothetical protein